MFIRFDTIHERDGHTHTRTHRQTPHDDIARAYASHRAAKNGTRQSYNYNGRVLGSRIL